MKLSWIKMEGEAANLGVCVSECECVSKCGCVSECGCVFMCGCASVWDVCVRVYRWTEYNKREL